MNKKTLLLMIDQAYKSDKRAHPLWPDHVVAQAGKVTGAAGKLMNSSLSVKYPNVDSEIFKTTEDLEAEAINTIVQAMRFIQNLKKEDHVKNRVDRRNLEFPAGL